MIKHSQSTQSKKFVISVQYLQKEVTNGVFFLDAHEHQSFYNLVLMFLMKGTRHVQSIKTRKLVICLQYIKKKVLHLLLCFIAMQNI